MTFFEQQHQARQETRKLVFLFALAVIAIVVAVNLAMALVWTFKFGAHHGFMRNYPKGFFETNTLITLLLIGGGTLIQTFNLRDGGDAVAQMAGGRLVSPATRDLQERRLLNVVEEMALASGIACPKVYLLEQEDAINAFAAGYNPNEAVVAVTRGTLNRLTRDELQGVVGHEFSHILNGDMRLNVHLIGVLFGIQMIAGFGQQLMNFGSSFWDVRDRNDKGPPWHLVLIVTGLVLFVVGYIGIFFGRLIKSAVSRQREFLADASAVQFTRNPDGIGGALRKIGGLTDGKKIGSQINHANAEQLSHLFLGSARPNLLDGWFATHPPLTERLRRIYGRSMGPLEAPELAVPYAEHSERLADLPFSAAGFAAAGDAVAIQTPTTTGTPTPSLEFGNSSGTKSPLTPQLDGAVRDPVAACAVIYALLLGSDTERDQQLAVLKKEAEQQAALTTYLAESIAQLPLSARLPLVDLAMPALRQLKQPERDKLLAIVDQLIAADNRITLAEFVLQTILARRLRPRAGRLVQIKFNRLAELKSDIAVLLSLVAHVCVPSTSANAGEARIAAFLRSAQLCPELDIAAKDYCDGAGLSFPRVRQALDNANRLAPLAKPQLVKALLAVADNGSADGGQLDIASADILRAICAGIEAPIPPAVAATYHAYPWQFDN
ncbi:peptidase M48 family protein [Collimonas arenae]|uniref:Peptidase M48 family protein n=1 Tax=Collimonas arenae TaxID=279058 RepID=A0A127PWD2_9BURK|nr:M48 family metallopeptidase [Collimonas arenae]AMP02150.1 peptidase M48 family protein [Collimonas arenae]AMP12046.1 peptidase M48 family protein [Collimonas arenae]